MAVFAGIAMAIDWHQVGDEYYLVVRGRDGSEFPISFAGSVFEAHGPKILAAMRKRAVAHRRPVASLAKP